VGVYVARYLGPEQYGLLSYAVSFVLLFSALSTLGLNEIVIRELVKDEEQRDVLLGTAFWLKVFGGIALFIVVMIAVKFTNSDPLTKVMVAIIAAGMLLDPFSVIDFYFQARVQSKFVAMAWMGAAVVGGCLKLVLIFLQAPLIWFAVALVAEKAILMSGYLFFYLKNQLSPCLWRFQWRKAVSLLNDSWPLIFSSFAVIIYLRIDQIFLKEMVGANAVGQYAVAVKLSEFWYVFVGAINASLFPAILKVQENHVLYMARLQRLYDLMAFLSIGVAFTMTILGSTIVTFLYGEAYTPAGIALSILTWSGIFVALGSANSRWLVAENYTRVSMINAILGAIINIVLNLFLIPFWGLIGASIATVISYSFSAYLLLLLYKPCWGSFKRLTKALYIPGGIARALS
jgi:O-antigen/teichoic acid export membrane protein